MDSYNYIIFHLYLFERRYIKHSVAVSML